MTDKYKLGWLAPDGSFLECGCFEHVSVAKELVEKFYPNEPSSHYDDVLLDKGWVHIGISAIDHDYYFWWNKFLTEPQKQFMKPYFETDGRLNLVWRRINTQVMSRN